MCQLNVVQSIMKFQFCGKIIPVGCGSRPNTERTSSSVIRSCVCVCEHIWYVSTHRSLQLGVVLFKVGVVMLIASVILFC